MPEYANPDITHNVEFTLHGSQHLISNTFDSEDVPFSAQKIIIKHPQVLNGKKNNNKLVESGNILRNACTICETNDAFVNIYLNSINNQYSIYKLIRYPFAMFECKRVGVEDGMKKGPQTIEKAKQGSYVARTVSSLQKIRNRDGSLDGIISNSEDRYEIGNYYTLLDKIINSGDDDLLNGFILTVGVISNHGNWFTAENANKELRVLAQSYDWLIFLTDVGISEFITDLLLHPSEENYPIQEAFRSSYDGQKSGNRFTKVRMDLDADRCLNRYFQNNQEKIISWFNIISPSDRTIAELRTELEILSRKNWEGIYR